MPQKGATKGVKVTKQRSTGGAPPSVTPSDAGRDDLDEHVIEIPSDAYWWTHQWVWLGGLMLAAGLFLVPLAIVLGKLAEEWAGR
jgi:hypothetical protein